MSPESRGWATREQALDAAKKAIDELNKRLDVDSEAVASYRASEKAESPMKQLTVFLLVFIPTLLIIYGVVSKVVISGRSEEINQGQEALRQN